MDEEAKRFRLEINQVKTKYMKTRKYKFETVSMFNYLGTNTKKVMKRIMSGNQTYSRNKKLLNSATISIKTKIKVYKILR